MSSFRPKVSIVIPVYNGSDYLGEAIDSALKQTYSNIEILVVDDGSTDAGLTEKIAESYGDKIRYIHKPNGGVGSALNLGIREMAGEYFSWLSHDDLYSPKKVETQVAALRDGTRADTVVATGVAYFDESGIFLRTSPKRDKHQFEHPLSYLFKGYINGCALLIPRTILMESGGFDEGLPTTQDFDLWFRILRTYNLVYVDKHLTLSRSHPNQGSKVLLNDHVFECDTLWTRMMNELDDVEKSAVFGSTLDFYSNIYNFLSSNSSYEAAILFARKAMLRIYGQLLAEGQPVAAPRLERLIPAEAYRGYIERRDPSKKTAFFFLGGDIADRGGLNRMVSALANELSAYLNVIVTYTGQYADGYALDEHVIHFRTTLEAPYTQQAADLSMLLEVDAVVFSHNCHVDTLMAIEECSLAGIKTIAWSHENYFLPYYQTKLYKVWPIRNVQLAKASAAVWLTAASCKLYAVSNSNGLVIPNFNPLESAIVPDATSSSTKRNLIAVGRWDDPQKGIGALLAVFERIHRFNSEITLTIVGRMDSSMPYSDYESIGQAIQRINRPKVSINTVGQVDDPTPYYQQADLNILPSRYEGFGLTILEAATFGTPTAVFDNSGFAEIIDDRVNGIVSTDADCNALANRILDLYKNEDQLRDMKQASLELRGKFDKGEIVSLWRKLIDDLVEGNKVAFPSYNLSEADIASFVRSYEEGLRRAAERIEPDTNRFNRKLKKVLIRMGLFGQARSAIHAINRLRYRDK